MPDDTSPSAVFERLIRGISDGRWHDLAELYAGDAVAEQPLAVAPAPARLAGRETIRAHFAGAGRMGLRLAARNVVVHQTTDPEVIVAEFDYAITTGQDTFTAANIQVLRIRDGLIRETRDYHDHLTLARATGQLPALVASLGGEPV